MTSLISWSRCGYVDFHDMKASDFLFGAGQVFPVQRIRFLCRTGIQNGPHGLPPHKLRRNSDKAAVNRTPEGYEMVSKTYDTLFFMDTVEVSGGR
jgi:hypothetical protein